MSAPSVGGSEVASDKEVNAAGDDKNGVEPGSSTDRDATLLTDASAPANPPDTDYDAAIGDAASEVVPPPPGPQDAGVPGPPPDPPEPNVGHIAHHFRFAGTGSTATDSVGTAHGQVVGATLDGSGDVVLPGGLSGPHVRLPSGMISKFQSASIETWLTWRGGGGFQRIFDFGNSDRGAGNQGEGTRHFSLALLEGRNEFRLVFDTDPATGSENWRAIFSAPAITTNTVHHVIAVFDRQANQIRLYVDGARRAVAAVPAKEGLSNIDDVNCWLGMAQWAADPNLAATLHDVRIFDMALNDADVTALYQFGVR